MFQKLQTEKYLWGWRWPIIIVVVLLLLLGIQILRVNRPRPVSTTMQPVPYSTPGILVSGDLLIPERNFYSRGIDLNRTSTLVGSFRTGSIKSRVSVLVLDTKSFEAWQSNSDYHPVTETGYVPGGKVTPVLEPGNYFIVIDNRSNEWPQSVRVEFKLD
jgi:hypothetical protein